MPHNALHGRIDGGIQGYQDHASAVVGQTGGRERRRTMAGRNVGTGPAGASSGREDEYDYRGIDEKKVYEEILRAGARKIDKFRERFDAVAGAQKAAAKLEFEKAGTAMDLDPALVEPLTGALDPGSASALDDIAAIGRDEAIRLIEGPEKLAPLVKESEEAISAINEEIIDERMTGAGAQMGSQMASTMFGMGAGGAASSGVPILSQAGAAVDELSGMGATVGGAIGGATQLLAETPEHRAAVRDIRRSVAGFEAPEFSYTSLLGGGAGYGSLETALGAGQRQDQRRRRREDTTAQDDLDFDFGASSGPYFG
mgnify:CR=1 FL=1